MPLDGIHRCRCRLTPPSSIIAVSTINIDLGSIYKKVNMSHLFCLTHVEMAVATVIGQVGGVAFGVAFVVALLSSLRFKRLGLPPTAK